MISKKPDKIFFRLLLLFAFGFVAEDCCAQNVEIGAFLSKHRNFGYVYGKSESSTGRDRFRSSSSFKEGGGIQGHYNLNNQIGIRGGFRYLPAEYNLEVLQDYSSVLRYQYFWNLKSKLFQLPIGIEYRLPVSNGHKSFKVFLDATADIRLFNVEMNRLPALTVGPEPPQSVSQSFSFTVAPKTKINAGANFGFGFTPFKCKNIELNALYHYSLSNLNVLDYQTQVEYTDQFNETIVALETGTIRIRPNYVMAQLVYYFITK